MSKIIQIYTNNYIYFTYYQIYPFPAPSRTPAIIDKQPDGQGRFVPQQPDVLEVY